MYIILMIIISILFFLQDKYLLKLEKEDLKKKSIIRIISNISIGTIIYYITNKQFIFTSNINLNNTLIATSIYLIINLAINLFINKKTKNIKAISKILLVILVLECTLFNYKHYLTFTNKEIKVTEYELINLIEENGYYYLEESNQSGIKINIKDIDLNSIYFKITDKKDKLMEYDINVLDNDSKKYIRLNSTNCYDGVKTSYYKTIYNTYDSDILYITFSNELDSAYQFDNIIINPNIPIVFSLARVLILLIVSIITYILRPSSEIYKIKANSDKPTVFISLFIFTMITVFLMIIITNLNRVFVGNTYYEYKYAAPSINEYQHLAEAIKEGQLYILEEPSDTLETMDNPYNTYYRETLFNNSDDYYIWDVAYFNDHYYVYFGIVPVLFTYLPVYLLTGNHISNNIVILIGLIGIILSIVFLLKELVKKYLKNISIGTLLLTLLFIIFGNHFVILYAAKRPDFYSIPIIWGVMFSLIGINLWLRSKKKDKLDKKYLLLGSLSMALVAGCRPQLLLSSFSAIIIFWDELKERKFFSKKNIKESIYFCMPYIIVALFLMWYNYARFGSPFDFGANYNLTTNDMTSRGFNLERIGLGLYYYLFALPNTTNIFPFINLLPKNTSYIGITIYERMFGGMISLSPLLIISLLFFKFKKYFKNKMLYYLTGWFTISALIIIVADTNMAGILPRYCIDFSWLLVISTVLIILNVLEYFKDNNKVLYYINKAFHIVTISLVIFNFLLMFVDLSFSYKFTLPTVFYNFYYMIQFWL